LFAAVYIKPPANDITLNTATGGGLGCFLFIRLACHQLLNHVS